MWGGLLWAVQVLLAEWKRQASQAPFHPCSSLPSEALSSLGHGLCDQQMAVPNPGLSYRHLTAQL